MGVNIQTIKDIKPYLAGELVNLYPPTEIGAITKIIIGTLTGFKSMHQIYGVAENLTVSQAEQVIKICNDLKTGKPIQYIIGETLFYDCIIKVNSSVLIPRQETEELVDLIIKENIGFLGSILDIATGSGCIAIALAKNLPNSRVIGTDISAEALALACENAIINKADVIFVENDILKSPPELETPAGIIVSNPPYVRNSEIKFMNRNVVDFEPHIALFVEDSDPLLFYRTILEHSSVLLSHGGKVYFEINEALGKPMNDLLESFGFTGVKIVNDLNGRERIIKGIKNGRKR
jgi:release factor glutamine methyltransferase